MIVVAYQEFWENVEEAEWIENIQSVSISLGCADFAKRDLAGSGTVPCFLDFLTTEGKHLGCGAYLGQVRNMREEELRTLWANAGEELTDDAIALAQGANIGDFIDPDNGEPICSECLAAAGEWHDPENSIYDPESEDYEPEARASEINPEKNQACWSCSVMIEEENSRYQED